MADIRGNVETRLAKLAAGQYDAIVLAEAGLVRLGLESRITQIMPHEIILPAVGQGALGVEARADDEATKACLVPIDDPQTHGEVLAERTLLSALRGGCLAPVGAWGRVERDGRLRLDAVVLSHDGRIRLVASAEGDLADARKIGQDVADDLLAQGAGDLIKAARDAT
jgi:hydroxymethylbilane synthase